MENQRKDRKSEKAYHENRAREIYDNTYYYSPRKIDLELAKKQRRKRKAAETAIKLFTVFAAAFLCCAFFYSTFFNLKEVETDSNSEYTAEEIRKSAGLVYGENLLSIDKNKVAKGISASIPYAGKVTVKKILPSKIKISVEKAEGIMYVTLGKSYYILSKDLTVLCRVDNIDKIELENLIKADSRDIETCLTGEKIRFSDEDVYNIFVQLLEKLEEKQLLGLCGEIDVTSKFNIKIMYQNRFEVILGDRYDIDLKLDFMQKIIETMGDTDSGKIDVSDKNLKEGVVSLYR